MAVQDGYFNAIESLGWQEVTMWFCWSRKWIRWELNHIDYGHAESDKPEGKTPQQKTAWATQRWMKRFTYGDKTRLPMRVFNP